MRKSLFYPQEHALICDYLGIPRPEHLSALDLWNRPSKRARGIWPPPRQEDDIYTERDPVAIAVAQIALGDIQNRLPQWALVTPDSDVILGRGEFEVPDRVVALKPVKVLSINWASTFHGDSPESYYATWLPIFEVWVVTASRDADFSGSADTAIGHFKCNPKAGAREVIKARWHEHTNAWEEVWDEGLLSVEEAYALAAEVWPDEVEGGGICTA